MSASVAPSKFCVAGKIACIIPRLAIALMTNHITFLAFAAFTVANSTASAHPCSELAYAKSFCFGRGVAAGTVISGARAFSQVLHLPDPARCFKEIMNNGSPEGKMYALVALREIDPALFRIEAGRLRGLSVVTLATEQGGVFERQSSETIIRQISDGVFHSTFVLFQKHLLRGKPTGD
jgi:hypothetical protein